MSKVIPQVGLLLLAVAAIIVLLLPKPSMNISTPVFTSDEEVTVELPKHLDEELETVSDLIDEAYEETEKLTEDGDEAARDLLRRAKMTLEEINPNGLSHLEKIELQRRIDALNQERFVLKKTITDYIP